MSGEGLNVGKKQKKEERKRKEEHSTLLAIYTEFSTLINTTVRRSLDGASFASIKPDFVGRYMRNGILTKSLRKPRCPVCAAIAFVRLPRVRCDE